MGDSVQSGRRIAVSSDIYAFRAYMNENIIGKTHMNADAVCPCLVAHTTV